MDFVRTSKIRNLRCRFLHSGAVFRCRFLHPGAVFRCRFLHPGAVLGADFCILALILDADSYKIIARFGKPHLIIETSSTDTRNVIIQMLRAHVADYRRTISVPPFRKKIRHIQCHSQGKIVLLHPRGVCTACR